MCVNGTMEQQATTLPEESGEYEEEEFSFSYSTLQEGFKNTSLGLDYLEDTDIEITDDDDTDQYNMTDS